MKLSDDSILSALIAYGSPAVAAKALGCSTQPIYTRLRNPEFKAKVDEHRRENLTAACGALQGALLDAIRTARDILNDTENAPQVRLNAASMVLSNALRYTEQNDILQRLDALEAAQRGEQN